MEKVEKHVVVLFGESEKGNTGSAYYCDTLPSLFDCLGEPPVETQGLYFAVQSLMHGIACVYFRVLEEGISLADYELGFHILHNAQAFPRIDALYLPGVGKAELIEEGIVICKEQHSLLLMNEKDFYDYITDRVA